MSSNESQERFDSERSGNRGWRPRGRDDEGESAYRRRDWDRDDEDRGQRFGRYGARSDDRDDYRGDYRDDYREYREDRDDDFYESSGSRSLRRDRQRDDWNERDRFGRGRAEDDDGSARQFRQRDVGTGTSRTQGQDRWSRRDLDSSRMSVSRGRNQDISDYPDDDTDSSYYRGFYSRGAQPYSYQGGRGVVYSESLTLSGPYSGRGPKGYKRGDDQICEEANQRLERDGRIDASEIEVSCDDGVLKLKGKVEDRRAKREAEDCVEDVYGVEDVMNELKVDQGFFAGLFGSSDDEDEQKNRRKNKNTSRSASASTQ